MTKQKIIVIVGPNASGKSDFGVRLAKKINGEIISADSRQVYKGLDIGSGKVSGKWKVISGKKVFVYKNINHHCIDIANPKKVFSALDFKKCAENAIADIISHGKTPIIVGGTGFYIDAALGRVKLSGVPPNRKLRKDWSRSLRDSSYPRRHALHETGSRITLGSVEKNLFYRNRRSRDERARKSVTTPGL